MALYGLYSTISNIIFNEIIAISYLLESSVFVAWASWIMLRPEINTAKTIDNKNILLAFYNGNSGSSIMNLFQLFGMPVKSLCILAGDKALYLKKNKNTFEFGNSSKIHKKSYNYIIIDTGVPHTENFIKSMEEHKNIIATKGIFRVRCIEAVSGLLGMIGNEFKPKSYIPSLYLWRVINCQKT
jgi:hypothetical protein